MPADGLVLEGRSYVDESMVTGESKPVAKKAGDAVISGTVNSSGPLIVKVRPSISAFIDILECRMPQSAEL